MPNNLFQSTSNSRIVVFDQSMVSDFLRATELVSRLKRDVVAFSIANGPCSACMRLMALGARWVFDSASLTTELEAGFSELLQFSQSWDLRMQRFNQLLSLIESITSVEKDVLNIMLEGKPNIRIAEQLNVSVRTIEARRARIYRKCNVTSIVGLVRCVVEYESLREVFH